MTALLPPRVVVAGTHSGAGKTTVATGLMAALRRRGHRVGAAKVGPDFIDPGYHALAVGRPSRNLDAWISGPGSLRPLAAKAGQGCDLLVVEGVMGLFDGADDGTPSSTADVAAELAAPVLLVVDAAGVGRSVAAVVAGFAGHDPRIRVAGVVLDRVGSDGHRATLVDALAASGIPVVGALPRDPRFAWRDRHLGLVPVVERPDAVRASLDVLADQVARHCDLDLVEQVARSAPPVPAGALRAPRPSGRARVAVASGPAFSFLYPDNVEALAAAGAEVVPFDPLTAPSLPPGTAALVAGGGFPEVHVEALAANGPLLADVARRVDDGLVVWAECGGLLWLARRLDGRPMAGVVPTEATTTERLTLGYRTATLTAGSPLGPAGTVLRGHEHHYTTCTPPGGALDLRGSRQGRSAGGFAGPRLLAGYLHLHLADRPELAERFVAAAAGGTTSG
ncbi:MAG: cobyrinate a,c-diamide synthase [Acidimicrobiia bacterium]